MRLAFHLALFGGVALAGVNAQLEKVQSVYILPMGGGMDQFLANRITQLGKIQVVANPQNADAILTDRLGEVFEKKLDKLYGSTTKVEEVKEETDDAADADPDSKAATKPKAKAILKEDPDALARVGSFGRGKGTFFLVDRKTRAVIWSVYDRPKNTSADELNKTAEQVVKHLKKDLMPAQPGQ